MKFCKDCQHSKKEYVTLGPQAAHQAMLFCKQEDCLNPVDASMFPCELVRREAVFCGITAKYFKAKEETPPEEPVKEAGNVIQLS